MSTGIYDNFSGGTYDPWWNDAFKSWPLQQYPPGSGNYVSVAGGDLTAALMPSGASISGDFVLESTFQLGPIDSPPAQNESVHLFLYKSSDNTILCNINWHNSYVRWYWGNSDKDIRLELWSAYKEIKVKLVRIGPTITAYWWNSVTSSWEAMSNPITYADPVYIIVNGADYNGFSAFNFEADSGFPYSSGLKRSQLYGQFMFQIVGQL